MISGSAHERYFPVCRRPFRLKSAQWGRRRIHSERCFAMVLFLGVRWCVKRVVHPRGIEMIKTGLSGKDKPVI
jgi:hypothetical protein